MIGHKIKNIRELRNFTQEFVAERLDISQAAYSKMEKGETKISDEKLKQIADVLEVKPEDIKAFDSQKYFNCVNNVEGDYSGITIRSENIELIQKLYEDKVLLLEKLLDKTEKELEKYRDRFGEV